MRRLPDEVHVDTADGRVVLQVRGGAVRLSAGDARVVREALGAAADEVDPAAPAVQTEPGAP